MPQRIASLLAVAALAVSAVPAQAAVRTRHAHVTLTYTVSARTRSFRLPVRGSQLYISSIAADGHVLTLTQGNNSDASYIYGHGVALAILQHGQRWTLRAASITGTQRLRITCWT